MIQDLTDEQRARAAMTLREVLALVDAKELDASSAERAFLAGVVAVLAPA